jgi:hypothetical protein
MSTSSQGPTLFDDVLALLKHLSSTPIWDKGATNMHPSGIQRRMNRRRARTKTLVDNIVGRFQFQ